MEGEPMHGLDVESIFGGTGIGLGSRLLHVYTTHESFGRMRTALWAPVDIAPYTAGGRRLGAEKRQVRARVR